MRWGIKIKSVVAKVMGISVLAAAIVLLNGVGAGATGPFTISGNVTNQAGVGVANVSIYATAPGNTTLEFGPATTAPDGSYNLQVNTGSYDLHFDPPSGSNLSSTVDSNVSVLASQTINIALVATAHNVSGTFTDASGNPMANATIVFNGQVSGSSAYRVMTDSNGYYTVSVTPDLYDIALNSFNDTSLSGGLSDGGNNFVVDASNGNVIQNLQLDTVTVNVVVKDVNGNPVANAQASELSTGGTTGFIPGQPAVWSPQNVTNQKSDPSGTVALTVLRGLSYQFCGSDPTTGASSCTSASITGDNSTVNITTPVTHNVSGNFTDSAGNPISGAKIFFNGQVGGSSAYSITTDSNGHFSIYVNPDLYDLALNSYSGDGLGHMALNDGGNNYIVNATSGDVVQNLQLSTVTLNVAVKDANGNPVANAQAIANAAGGTTHLLDGQPDTWAPGPGTPYSQGSDANGLVSLTVLSGLTYQVCGSNPSTGGSGCTSVAITNNNMTVNITASITHTVSGTFTDSNGNPIINATIVFNGAFSGSFAYSATTDSAGHYSVNVAPDIYDLDTTSFNENGLSGGLNDGGNNYVVDASTGNVSQNLQLDTVTVNVVVKDVNGNPVANAKASEFSTGGTTGFIPGQPAVWSPQNVTNQKSDPSGTVTLTVLKGLTYQICGSDPNTGARGCTSTTVTGDNTTVIIQEQSPTPSAPSNLSILSPTQHPSLTWTAVSGATSYNIYRNGTKVSSSTGAAYTDTNAPEGTDTYYVTAVNSGGESSPSNSVNVVVDRTPPVLGTPSWTINPMTTTQSTTVTVPVSDNLTGVAGGEYYLGATDPGQGHGTATTLSGGNLSASFSNMAAGIYTVNFRAKDNAGNWSPVTTDYLVVYNATQSSADGHSNKIVPVYGADVLTGLVTSGQTDAASMAFTVKYNNGALDTSSKVHFAYNTGTNCNNPNKATNCHTTTLNSKSIDWMVVSGTNNSVATIQGTATVVIDGVTSINPFRVIVTDGALLSPATSDQYQIKIFAPNSNPNSAQPTYFMNDPLSNGNVIVKG